MSEGGPPPGVNSAMLASMEQGSSGSTNGGAAVSTGGQGFASVVGGENALDTLGKGSSMDGITSSSFGTIQVIGTEGGALGDDNDPLSVFDGNSAVAAGIGSVGQHVDISNINNAEAMSAGQLGFAKQTNTKGHLQGLRS